MVNRSAGKQEEDGVAACVVLELCNSHTTELICSLHSSSRAFRNKNSNFVSDIISRILTLMACLIADVVMHKTNITPLKITGHHNDAFH